MKTVKGAGWFVFFLIIAISCVDTPDCFQLNNNLVQVAFKILGGASDQVPVIGIDAPGTDSVFYQYQKVSTVQLPLNPFENETTFNFHTFYNDNQMVLGYTYKIQFVSEECGERYIFSDLSIKSYDYDSVRFVGKTLTQPPSTNIEIYRCPRTNFTGVSFKKMSGTAKVQDTVLINAITPNFTAGITYPPGYYRSVDLPLNPNTATTSFTFEFGDGTTKVLTVGYTRSNWTKYQQFCGNKTLIYRLSISEQDFGPDKVKLALKGSTTQPADSIQDPPITNLEIFK
ncbi:MAG: hypothetical protein JNM57_06470 [Cyclobacteriaceae bacterium]|nr:hypothetical protein [Cyclobacteriaceae bacterium]